MVQLVCDAWSCFLPIILTGLGTIFLLIGLHTYGTYLLVRRARRYMTMDEQLQK